MGQKTNPTALRLEKTNQHYSNCWYSDRFYLEQLHNNYKIHKYITKVFYKVKKMPYFRQRGQATNTVQPLIYRKVGHKINKIFCIFPRYKKKYFYSFASTRKGRQKTLNHKTNFKIETLRTLHSKVTFLHAIAQCISQGSKKANLILGKVNLAQGTSSLATVRASLGDASVLYEDKIYKSTTAPVTSPRERTEISPLVKTLFYKHSRHRELLEPSPKAKKGVAGSYATQDATLENYPAYAYKAAGALSNTAKANRHKSRLARVIASNSDLNLFRIQAKQATLPPLERGSINAVNSTLAFSLKGHDLQDKTATTPPEKHNTRLAQLFTATMGRQFKGCAVRQSHVISGQASHATPYVPVDQATPYNGGRHDAHLYLIKAGNTSSTLNSQFLAQRVCNGLKNRFTFPRLRRTVLWDIKKSKYVKGVRVTVSGRLETRSKKAQKARSRTFQWGQTELHVLSSLVQFTRHDVITPRGKIGVKVWICYGD